MGLDVDSEAKASVSLDNLEDMSAIHTFTNIVHKDVALFTCVTDIVCTRTLYAVVIITS